MTGRRAHRKAPTATAGREAIDLHRVQPGDTFASIARAYYGDDNLAQFLMEQNPEIQDPRRLAVGNVIRIPGLPAGRPETAPARAPSDGGATRQSGLRTYRVKAGDSFYQIARDVLGNASRWTELFELNRSAVHGDAKRLQINQIIKLPPQ